MALLASPASAGGARELGVLTIGQIGLRMPFYAGTTDAVLAVGPGHYAGTGMPGVGYGVVGIAAHRVTPVGGKPWGPFRWLGNVRPGAIITATTPGGVMIRYRVARILTVPVEAPAWYLDQTPSRETLVLTTCTPPHRQDHRLVVLAPRIV